MRTGRSCGPAASRGFTYVGLLLFLAITGAALAALGQSWRTAVQREKERELEFRGEEIARAIQAYVMAPPGAATGGQAGLPGLPGQQGPVATPKRFPRSLDDLLVDNRGLKARYHLRRRYADPLTGKPDWVLLPAPEDPQGFQGVRSRSDQALMRRLKRDGTPLLKASEWVFQATDGAPAAPAQGASAPALAASSNS